MLNSEGALSDVTYYVVGPRNVFTVPGLPAVQSCADPTSDVSHATKYLRFLNYHFPTSLMSSTTGRHNTFEMPAPLLDLPANKNTVQLPNTVHILRQEIFNSISAIPPDA